MAPSTFAPGHLLVNRYRIQALLGVGQTAEVYLADDASLQRSVVVKVLLPRLAGHEDVRRAFRDRIIQAATLSHPHLARVYDGGQESGSIFMICEYLSGGSLETVLATGRRLSVDDGARLGRDVSSALAYIHENGIVHGALKPSKLLLDDEGRVRVSDIALAGLGSAYRDRLSLDDVRFLSPEQAIGDPPGPKSDVYSLALILYEAVTGATPFDGVTPEAVLRARINASLPMRPELGTLDMLLAQAAVSDPALRLDAEQFASRLGAVVSDFAPLVLAPVSREVPLLSTFRPAEPRTSVGFRPPSPDQITGTTPHVATRRPGEPRHARPADEWVTSSVGGVSQRGRGGIDDFDYSSAPRTRRLAFLAAAIVILVVAIGGGVVWGFGLLKSSTTVPSLINANFDALSGTTGTATNPLAAKLKADGFTVSATKREFSATVPLHGIISQSPLAGSSGKSGLVITVTVSEGKQLATLPGHLVGSSCNSDIRALRKVHVKATCPSSHAIASASTPTGLVARVLYNSSPNPLVVPTGASVILELSTGPSGTTSTTTTTTPVSGTTTTTTTIAPVLVAVPNVVGMGETQVHAAFHAAGLYYSTTGPGSGATPTWTSVVSEAPAAGTMVAKLSNVILTVK
jgi:serine/threonine-protein kinase